MVTLAQLNETKAEIKKLTGLNQLNIEEQQNLKRLITRFETETSDYLAQPASDAPWPTLGNGYNSSGKSLGELFVGSETFKGYDPGLRSAPTSTHNVELKAVLTETGYTPQAIRTGRNQLPAERTVKLLDVLASGSTNQSSVGYMEETTTTNASASVAEGAAKPESTLVYTERTSPVRKIATVLPVTDELLDDVPAMKAFLEARLGKLLRLEVERQVLSGSGAGTDLTGLLTASITNYDATGAFVLDAINSAMENVRVLGETDPTAVVINPADWHGMTRATTADGDYIFGAPTAAVPTSIWGLPVIVTSLITAGTILVGDFAAAAQIFWRSDVAFSLSNSHDDFFVKNKTMLRVECRLALPIYRLTGFCKATNVVVA